MNKLPKKLVSPDKHPYMTTYKWDGPLAFWRKNPSSYTAEAIAYYEGCLKRWKEKENNMANLTKTV